MRNRRMVAVLAVLAVVTVACGDDNTAPTTTQGGPASGLKAACGDKLILQTDWFPEPEHGAMYQLIGPDGTIDKERGVYSGPIGNTGVTLEIRAGGPFVGYQQVTSQMYTDRSIFMGFVSNDEAVQNSANQRTVAVVTPLEKNPMVLMWPADKFDFKTFADIGRSGATVLYFGTQVYADYLVAKGDLKREQLDGSYDGSPARFVAEKNIVQQGFATNEPYYYEHADDPVGVKGFGKPVHFLLIHDSGLEMYPEAIAVRPETLAEKKECLKQLVPLIQKAQVDFIRNPQAINDALIKINKAYDRFWQLSAGGNAYAVKTMLDLGIVSNGSDKTMGNFDVGRVQKVIDALKPIFDKQGKPVKDGLKPDDIVDNEFIDNTIGL